MAPRAKRANAASPNAFHELGVRGRKTGALLPDRGERDEYGMQPLDAVFSSPRKAPVAAVNADDDNDDDDYDSSGSGEMDIASSAGPGPRTVLRDQRNLKYPIPRSRSPRRTNLKSPARKNPHLDRLSSSARRPVRQDPADEYDDNDDGATVMRRLNFTSKSNNSRNAPDKSKVNGSHRRRNDLEELEEEEEEEEEEEGDIIDDDYHNVDDMVEQSLRLVEDLGSVPSEDSDDEPTRNKLGSGRKPPGQTATKQPTPKRRHRLSSPPPPPPPDSPIIDEEDPTEESEEEQEQQPPAKRLKGRPSKSDQRDSGAKSTKPGPKKRPSLQISDDDEEQVGGTDDDTRTAKRQKTKGPSATASKLKSARQPLGAKAKPATSQPPKRGRGRPKKTVQTADDEDDETGEASFMAIQRGPPMPKSRGLVSLHRDADSLKQTRSGRHSYRPVEFWRGEQVVREEEELDDMFYNGDFVMSGVKEVVRVPKDLPVSKAAPRGRPKGTTRGKMKAVPEEEEELEEWETNPGTVTGEIVLWEPEHEQHPPADDEPVQVMDERIAISADAVQTTDIRDATFRFAKTLAMPFMGAGVVDLPPGSEKRPKNSRKMHMVFFVHYGKVKVTINEAQFRISSGGTWFVPRGNYYSISNDYQTPSRIFFAQGCEVAPVEADAEDQSTMALQAQSSPEAARAQR